jgi:hypothetical protein
MKDDEGGKLANAAAKALREYHASRGEFVPKVDNAAIGEAESKAKNEAWWTKVREAEDAKREKSRSEAIEWAHKNIDYTGPLHALTQDQAGALHWMRIERDTRKDAKDFAELKATIDNWRAEPEKADQAGNKAVSSYWKSRFRKYSYSWNKENKKHMPQLGEAADVAGDLWREANERLIKGQWYGWGEHDPLKKHEEAVKAACEAGKADEVPIEYLEENSYQSWVPAEIKGKIEDQHALRDFRNYRDGPEHRAIMRDLRAARSAARDILRPILDRADEAKTVKLRDPEAYAKLDQEIEKNARDAESNKSALEYIARESGHKASIYTLLNDNVKPELRDEWKWRNDARLQYNVKSGQLTRAKREMDREAQEDWLWHVLGDEQPTGEGHVNFSGADFLDDAGKDHLDHAAAFLQKLLGGRLGRIDVGLKRNTSKDGRESASGHSVNLEPNSPTWTIIHEVGHVIDHHAGGELGHYSRAYAVQRLAEQRVEPAWPGTRYERWERMHQDGMRDEYCGKFYPYHDANEILSMGIQWLFWDAHDFYDQDPDHFEYTLAALRGLLT